ncbi:Para-aminobenzoate synthase component 1 [Tritonibacter multivorans]|uniref:Para-aminobenzoate synthase component 1 n=1 Tax=Tritonibacter multivorans TaxID=928856 RepID=A0A0P1G4I3_9RHOB|nr:aminodeoxychorismate synthase component I [Tritonibacter multivorans]MDA7421852.1 aminodeoxychorismate synthase component I [Tritonibacter multivorans]CUH76751.1 Para-aminobenzoate synthase component 1 [Tritonibacter multivorans]SFD07442.1 aminodeoxychorismate synthase, subunit I [Tritonibacter multivorans]
MLIRFDRGPDGTAQRFAGATRVITAWEPDEARTALAAIEAARAEGAWVAGYASYELGYALEPKLAHLMPEDRKLPLLQFGVYDGPVADAPVVAGEAGFGPARPKWDEARYTQAFDQVKAYIGAGDFYQANLTFPIEATAEGTPEALYAALQARQPVGYGALIEQEGLPAILSRSPELFFRTTADGVIETRPMKGTQPRSKDPVEDAKRRDFLRQDEKNRAENLMIVDLLRNDISRVARTGSVHVPELFAVESYATVHQMVSLVRAELASGKGLDAIFEALFPCGSITGAPKIRSMEVIRELEPEARDIYCGSIGWAAPDGRSEFNVAIRTVMLDGDQARFNVGGGLVWDSTAASEYEEALWKARFAQITNTAMPSETIRTSA